MDGTTIDIKELSQEVWGKRAPVSITLKWKESWDGVQEGIREMGD